MREKKEEKQSATLPVYESHPPPWLPKIHGTADLGYVGFHPPRPGQDEDGLSESNIKNGFILPQAVPVESFSAHAMINESLHSTETLTKLEELMNEVFIRRADRVPPVPSSTFRIPTRVTLNDAKRQAWFADLANPDVPLYKLGKSVPHGAKGGDLLDLLHSNNVEISRAVWFLRVFGANETAGLRNKPSYVPTQYSIDWANVVTGYMKKQLVEIALPSAPRPLLNIKQTFKGVLADPDTREKWMSRFTYCLKLLRTFYAEDLVDHRTFLTWLVHQMITCNLAQSGFLTRLADEYLGDILFSRALSKPLVEACLAKLSEIRTASARDFLKDTEDLLKVLLQRACLTLPDAFVSPKMWSTYSSLLDEIMFETAMTLPNARSVEQNTRDLEGIILDNFADIKKRNEALLFRGPIAQVSARLGTAVSDVKLLNSIFGDTEIGSISYFRQDINDISFKEKLDLLLDWSVTPLQYGDHRPFAAVTLIRIWRDKARDRASRRDITIPSELLQDRLFDWLDTSDVAGDPNNIRYIALLYGKLVKHEIFSYASYIQRLIARGEAGLSNAQGPASRHRLFLSWIPLFNSTPSLIHQRRVTLHGARARDIPEDATEREIRREIRTVTPDLFEGATLATWSSTTTLLERCKKLMTATRFEQVRTFRHWLLPVFKKSVAKAKPNLTVLFKSYIIAIELMTAAKCFHSALDLSLCMLEHSHNVESMNSLINTFYRYATIWSCMDVMPTIVKALDDAHHVWKLRGLQSRPLLALLMRFDGGRHLDGPSRERIASDIAAFTLALQPIVDQPDAVPQVLPEILLLAGDPNPNASFDLANRLWIKYRTSTDWAWKVWDNAVASLRQIPSMTPDIEARRACALRYGDFLWRVDQHLPKGLDNDVLQWLLGPGKAEVMALSTDAWDVLKAVLLFLVVHGALKTTTVLQGLIYPAWQLGVIGSAGQSPVSETYLSAANKLAFLFLLQEDANEDIVPPTDLFEVQCIRTRRQAVYNEPHFPLLVASIPTLISLENNDDIPESLRTESTALRCRICQEPGFRRGAYRNLDVIREAFENSPYLSDEDPSSEHLSKRAIAGLKMILCDSTDETNIYDWPEVTCLLTPWKIAATTIQMQLQVKQLGRALNHEPTSECATANLNKLTSMLFHHTKTAEEAYYVGEMARGADSTVAAKFVNNGLQCMTEFFSDPQSDSADCVRRVGELLRVLIHVSQPFRESPAALLSVDPQVQEAFVVALDSRFKELEAEMQNDKSPAQSSQNLILLSRLLHFILSFKSTWTSKSKETFLGLPKLIFRLTLHTASEGDLYLNTYPILIDTLLVLYDEIFLDSKSIAFDPFRYYPNIPINDLPSDMPPEYRKQMATLLARLPSDSVVTDLVLAHHDSQGNVVYGAVVVNKPWEWIENLGEPILLDPKEEKERDEKERLKVRHLFKNSGSIPMENFGTLITGDSVKSDMLSESENAMEGCLRSFGDGLSESIFIRDWRETRLESKPSPDTIARLRGEDSDALVGDASNPQALRASPTSSTISRSSTQATTSSGLRQHQPHSPSQTVQSQRSNSTLHEVIDVDSLPMTGTSKGKETMKRKATAAAISDDEVEIIAGPVPGRSTVAAKKQKANKGPAEKSTRARKK
ncbi:hypothetical protein GALMADRAFT_249351 [Galerina marginata CBS 339.88]|uniref:Mediator of RNA polymerase II transcription subunit 12 n=1 Tax=Galerina marginata (strain CBS 339.88) TaxID=685588 RepID=A0A067SWN9_GALM3|nr:hypothetical protein GALMADRAFT_249351 [Galerina marginata CBS 339.88]